MTQPQPEPFVQYDYTNQAWLSDGVYQKCGHIECNAIKGYEKECFGSKHEGEGADPDADIHPTEIDGGRYDPEGHLSHD